jgi:hypothetical protein
VLAHLNPHVPHVPGFLITFVLKVRMDAYGILRGGYS